jgi:hypothetical protein
MSRMVRVAAAAAPLLLGAALLLPGDPARADGRLLGGVQGVVGAADEGGLGSRSAFATRSFQVVPALQPMLPPVAAPARPPESELRLWLEGFPDMRVPIGTRGRLNVAASRPGQLMLWTMAASGAVFPIADGMTAGRDVVAVGPGRTAVLPRDQGFELAMCPPTGQAIWFALHSDGPIPDAARQRLARDLSEARIGEADGAGRFRAVLDRVLAETPGWSARGHTLVYEVLPGPADPACAPAPAAAPSAPPEPAAPPPAALPPPGGPAFPSLRPTTRPIEVRLDAPAYRAQETMRLEVRVPVACPSLTVLALGAAGAVDVLLPNARPLPGAPAAHETVRLPSAGSGIELRVRTPSAAGATERVVALCDAGSGQALVRRRDTDGPTTTLLPGEPAFTALARSIEEARSAGRLLVGEASYTNLGGR